MHAGVQRQFSARQIQDKQALISWGGPVVKQGESRHQASPAKRSRANEDQPNRGFDHKGVQCSKQVQDNLSRAEQNHDQLCHAASAVNRQATKEESSMTAVDARMESKAPISLGKGTCQCA
ncbi:MAG: hypothetical protein IPN53_07115 [Comamonadaceae bacterium]|nr:hypothetical protein [Comamonadaceae bacterium]